MRDINIQVPDDLYEAFENLAKECNKSVDKMAAEWLGAHPLLFRREREGPAVATHKPLGKYFGAHRSGNPRSADNVQMDADLVTEYEKGLKG